jgi:hypothetical protein
MKKLAAILLLGIFVFNLFGYQLWVLYIENNAKQHLQSLVDNNGYNEDELILIKKPINLPYYNNTKDFSRADGQVEINGVVYKYVKSRIYNDSLQMLCLPNTDVAKIHQAKDDYFKTVVDIQKNNQGKNKSIPGSALKKMISDFENNTVFQLKPDAATSPLTTYPPIYNSNLGTLHKTTVEQPPDFC